MASWLRSCLLVNNMSLSNNIKRILSILHKATGQIPLDKQPLISSKIARIIEKYNGKQDFGLLKELEFNLNFVRLSFPNLDYSPPVQEAPRNENEVSQERINEEIVELENKAKVQQFMKETERVVAGVREEVQFTNWGSGNIDPEDLKRHKELLKRQFFGGEHWKGKEKPISPTAVYLTNLMANQPEAKNETITVADDPKPIFSHDPDQNWEKVKR